MIEEKDIAKLEKGRKPPEQLKIVPTKILEWLRVSESSIPEVNWREEAEEDYEFYAGRQDDDYTISELEAKNRPATVYNEIFPKVNNLKGSAAKARYGISFAPVGEEDDTLAEMLNGVYLHYKRKQKLARKELDCFDHTVKSGRSLLFFYVDGQNPFKPEVKARRIPGDQFYTDPSSIEPDRSDARFIFVERWWDEDALLLYFPKVPTEVLKSGYQLKQHDFRWFDQERELYRTVECWYKDYERRLFWINPMSAEGEVMSGTEEDFNLFVNTIAEGVETEAGTFRTDSIPPVKEGIAEVIKFIIFTGNYELSSGYSPYKNLISFPCAYLQAYNDNAENRPFSIVSQLKDPQRMLNTGRRQLVHLLQTLPKGIFAHETGAVLDIDAFEKRSSDPTYHMELAPGGLSKIQFFPQPPISPVYNQFDATCTVSMKAISGVHDDLMGVEPSSREPYAVVQARQEANLTSLWELFENFKEFKRQSAEIFMRLLQQYVTYPEYIRIEGEKGKQLITINAQLNPQSKGISDLSALEFDITAEDSVETSSMRQATAQALSEFSHNNPGVIPPDTIVNYSNVPFTEKQRIRSLHEQQLLAEQEMAALERYKVEKEFALKEEELRIKRLEAEAKIAVLKQQSKEKSKSKD